MQRGSFSFRQGVIRSVAHQAVPEAEARIPAPRRRGGREQLPARQQLEAPAEILALRLRRERGHLAERELLADDRRPLEHRSIRRVEPVEPRREQRFDRGRDRDVTGVRALFERDRDHLLEKERVPFRRFGDPRRDRRVERAAAGMLD